MNVVTGDATGLVKVVNLKTNGSIKRIGTQDAVRGGITAMCWAGATNPESEVAIALSKGSIEVWNTATEELTASLQGLDLHGKSDRYVGLHVLRSVNGPMDIHRSLLSVSSLGAASISPWLPYLPDLNGNSEYLENPSLTKAQKELLKKKEAKKHAEKIVARQKEYDASTTQWKIGTHIENIRMAPALDVFAAGGKENRFKLWDIETQKPVYASRQLANDYLNMTVPNWDLDFTFLCRNGESMGDNSMDNNVPFVNRNLNHNDYKIVTSTSYHKVRIYDTKAGGRPVTETELDENARSIATSHDGNYVIVGDVAGRIQKLDVRKNLLQVGVMRGSCGSIRQIKLHPTLNMVASVSLDRHLRVHDLDTRKLLKEVYLKQKMTTCLFSSITPGKNARSTVFASQMKVKDEEDRDDIDDEIWNILQANTQKMSKKSSGSGDGENSHSVKHEADDGYTVKSEDGDDDNDSDDNDDVDVKMDIDDEDGDIQNDSDDEDEDTDDDIDMDDLDEDDMDLLNFLLAGGAEGEFDFGFEGEGEGEGDDFSFLNDIDEDDFDEDDYDEDDDEDDYDEDEEFDMGASSFVILGKDGKPISKGNAQPLSQQPSKQSKQEAKPQPKKTQSQPQPQSSKQTKQAVKPVQPQPQPKKSQPQATKPTKSQPVPPKPAVKPTPPPSNKRSAPSSGVKSASGKSGKPTAASSAPPAKKQRR